MLMKISYIEKGKNGKTYMVVDGKPFLYNAVQSMYPKCKDYTEYIKKAAEANFTVFSFWLYWRWLEPQKGVYDFTEIDKVIDVAVENDIRLDIIWAGTNFCDHLDHRFAPKWVFCDSSFYLKDSNGIPYIGEGYNDVCPESPVADPCNKELLKIEQEMFESLLSHLKEYDKTHRVIAIQIENEINMQGFWGGKEKVLSYVNELGRTVKESDYSVVTRINVNDYEMDEAIDKLEFIDGQGLDLYTDDLDVVRCCMRDERCTKFKHVAENDVPNNSTALLVTTLANGGFYNIYRIDDDLKYKKPGVYDSNLDITEMTLRLRRLNQSLNAAADIVTTAAPNQILEFNTENTNFPIRNYSSMKYINGNFIGMQNGGYISCGMAIFHDGYYYCIADDFAEFFVYSRVLECETGEFIGTEWKTDTVLKVFQKKIKWDRSVWCAKVTPGKVLRIKIAGHTNEMLDYREKTRELWNDEKRMLCGEKEPWYDKCEKTNTV